MSLSEIHNYYEDLVENYIDALELNQTRSYRCFRVESDKIVRLSF